MAEIVPAKNGKRFASQQSLDAAVWGACDILRRSGVKGALQYVPELSWMLFLRILDERETQEAEYAAASGRAFTPSLVTPYRWQDWAAPSGAKRAALQAGALGAFKAFVNDDLLPHLRGLRDRPNATPRQQVISQIVSGIERTRVDTERNLLDVLDRVDAINEANIDSTHIFPLSQVFEGLLLKMGEKGNDGGQFFTPREIIRAMVRTVMTHTSGFKIGRTVYDPCCGTGGFLAQAYEYVRDAAGDDLTGPQLDTLAHDTFYGREVDDVIYPITLANLVLHGIDTPHIWHGNTLTRNPTYEGLWQDAPGQFDIILTNPPFGGKEGKEAQINYSYRTSATQVLFLQQVIKDLKPGGTCGIVLDEGVLFRTNESAFAATKRWLLDECDLWAIVSLPGGVFTAAGAGVKTNLLFFTKGTSTKSVWYYDLSNIKVGKKTPLTLDRFAAFFELLPSKGDSERSWTVTRAEIEATGYDLKAVNPNAKGDGDTRTPTELLDLIEAKGREVSEALMELRAISQ